MFAMNRKPLMTEKQVGRPAPLGRKVPVGIRLTPDAIAFCDQHPEGKVFLETLLRRSKEFKAWMKAKESAESGK
jgi:hypothetical protein